MEIDRSGWRQERSARQTERIRRELRDSGIPVVALSEGTEPVDAWFGGMEQSDDAIVNVTVVYVGAASEDPWVSVGTGRRVGTVVDAGPLRWMIEHHMRRRGDPISAVEWVEGDATVVFDGEPVAGRIMRAGSQWWAVRCERGDVEISVVARGWEPEVIAVDTVLDVGPMLDRLGEQPSQSPAAAAVPEGLSGEPHRALVDVVLRTSRAHAQWLADGGPMPELPRYWAALWRAAVQRHMALTDQTEAEARDAVSVIVDQLSNLQQSAAWFREDGRLRERAIAETLLFGTGLSDNVASRLAQHAWLEKRGTPRRTEATAHLPWLDEWAAWVEPHQQR